MRLNPFITSPQSFSAVVGPNGSGKSNVIDAMLFVFGRRAKQVTGAHDLVLHSSDACVCMNATAQLRFNKISELIHNSTNHRNCECARVTVFFQEVIDKVRMHGQCLVFKGPVILSSLRMTGGPGFRGRSGLPVQRGQDGPPQQPVGLLPERQEGLAQGRDREAQGQGHRPGQQPLPHPAGKHEIQNQSRSICLPTRPCVWQLQRGRWSRFR